MSAFSESPRAKILVGTCLLFLICSAATAFATQTAFRDPNITDQGFWVLLIVPASAALVYLASGLLAPNLIPGRSMGWTLVATLPIVYSAIVQLCAALWLRGPNPIVQQQVFVTAAGFWQRWETSGLSFLAGVLAMAAWKLISDRVHS